MVKIQEIISFLEEWAPLSYQEDFDNAGLQLGNPDQEFKKGLISLDVRQEVLEEAVENGCNLIVTHHPLLFHPLRRICGNTLTERLVVYAVQHGLTIVSMHTNLDNVCDGVNASFASRLPLEGLKILRPSGAAETVGSGMIGSFPAAVPESDFVRMAKKQWQLQVLRHSRFRGKNVRKVALCGGAGAFLLPDALAAGADAFVVGEAHYHDFVDFEDRILILEIGHFESEQWIKYDLFAKLNGKFSNFAISKREGCPYCYQ